MAFEAFTGGRIITKDPKVSGTAFLKYNGIPFAEGSRSYPAVWQDGLLIISLTIGS